MYKSYIQEGRKLDRKKTGKRQKCYTEEVRYAYTNRCTDNNREKEQKRI